MCTLIKTNGPYCQGLTFLIQSYYVWDKMTYQVKGELEIFCRFYLSCLFMSSSIKLPNDRMCAQFDKAVFLLEQRSWFTYAGIRVFGKPKTNNIK